MEARTLSEALRRTMLERSWTQNELAHQLGTTQVWVSRVIRGATDPGIGKAAPLLARIGLEIRIVTQRDEGDEVKRREFLAAAASVMFIPSPTTTPYHDPDYLRALSASLANNRYAMGGNPLVPQALAQVARVRDVMGSAKSPALFTAASELMAQATLILYDANNLGQAEHVGALALRYATQATDHSAQARAFDILSRVHLYKGDHPRGIEYAQRGLAIPDLSPDQSAQIHMRLGRALAATPGQSQQSREALEQALNTDGLTAFSSAALLGDVGIGLGQLRDYTNANSLLDEAAAQIASRSPLFQSQYIGRQVLTAIASADASFAADRMHALARVLPFVSSGRMTVRVARILEKTSHWAKDPEVGPAREQLDSHSKSH
ncbi:helix-turn-helix transcriptional regulator [Herbidospora galbida]|uniref:Helix-turn-helix transcriptional regulator n=1 Tax=Herbidospora galbida TaxID=2575442 RepID=A0A4U3MP92_9ACTN|nr:helix-turn-helix transcriptional regulator [Herbidospora galbida]TKK90552.1 helix-turn-helix transcriptional regulator [Herbidospora galbida]